MFKGYILIESTLIQLLDEYKLLLLHKYKKNGF